MWRNTPLRNKPSKKGTTLKVERLATKKPDATAQKPSALNLMASRHETDSGGFWIRHFRLLRLERKNHRSLML